MPWLKYKKVRHVCIFNCGHLWLFTCFNRLSAVSQDRLPVAMAELPSESHQRLCGPMKGHPGWCIVTDKSRSDRRGNPDDSAPSELSYAPTSVYGSNFWWHWFAYDWSSSAEQKNLQFNAFDDRQVYLHQQAVLVNQQNGPLVASEDSEAIASFEATAQAGHEEAMKSTKKKCMRWHNNVCEQLSRV